MKRSIKFILLILLLFSCKKVLALTADQTEIYINPGNSDVVVLSLYSEDKIKEIDFDVTWSSYDVYATFNTSYNSNIEGTKHNIIFDKPLTGKASIGDLKINTTDTAKNGKYQINIWNINAITEEDKIINYDSIDINVNVTGNKIENKKTYNFLDKIESDIVDIKLIDNVYEYSVRVNNDIRQLDLKPITKDDSYKVDITSQIINKNAVNTIIISVSDDYGHKQDYKINVEVLKEEKKIEIDNREFEQTDDYKSKWIVIGGALFFIFCICLLTGRKK